jgi:hypothetical protein
MKFFGVGEHHIATSITIFDVSGNMFHGVVIE